VVLHPHAFPASVWTNIMPICDAHLFKAGNSFTTNYTFLNGLSNRTGTPLISCVVSSIYVKGDLHTWNINFTVVVTCKTDDAFQITAKAPFSKSFLASLYQPLLAMVRVDNAGTKDYQGVVLDSMCVSVSNWTYVCLLLTFLLQHYNGFNRFRT